MNGEEIIMKTEEKTDEQSSLNLSKNFANTCINKELIDLNFKKCIQGYHLVNTSPVNETIWEDLNSLIFTSVGIEVYLQSEGSHLPGMDINTSIGGISNKSSKYLTKKQNRIDISSYRLTTVCSDKHCGDPKDIIQEINKRKNFEYYSIIVRDEMDKEQITYYWLLIPSNHDVVNPSSYNWEPTFGKRGKNKDAQVGWHTNSINGSNMSIAFSMSSQLWMHIEMTDEIKKFVIASCTALKKTKYNYIELMDKVNN